MDAEYLKLLRRALEAKGAEIRPGLSEEELAAAETDFGFRFPPDLRDMLATFLPSGDGWPDWRGNRQPLIEWLDEPADGIEFDVEENGIWFTAWGERPDDVDDAVEEARRLVASAPMLIPVYDHRYLPATPVERGNPVFSVMQADVVVYSDDLETYFADEFGAPRRRESVEKPRRIAFWSELSETE